MGESTTPQAAVAPESITEKFVVRAIGAELQLAREERGWSRAYLVTRLPSGVGQRTLLSYEKGTRHLTIMRFIELCHALGVSAAELLSRAFQRARLHLEKLAIEVDLLALLADDAPGLSVLHRWAHHKLRRQQSRVAALTPDAIAELADVCGCAKQDMANYLARFLPDERTPAEDPTENVIADVTAPIAQAST
jgi:transcriptional regulator with XRE-family HTH domain